MEPDVSVIMPVYNGGKHVREAVESILNQTFNNFELIIVNDGSTDDTGKILETYRREDRIRVITNEKRLNQATSRNIAIKESKGEYCAIMDADDVSMPDRLAKQVCFLDSNPQVSVVGSACYDIYENGDIKRLVIKFTDDGQIKRHLSLLNLKESCIPHTTAMIRREALLAIGLYNENYAAFEDVDLLIRMASKGYIFANLKEPLAKKRRMNQDSQGYLEKKIMYSLKREYLYSLHSSILDSLYQCYKDLPIPPHGDNLDELERRACAELYSKIGCGLHARSQMSLARKALFVAIRCYPFKFGNRCLYPAYFLWLDTLPLLKTSFLKAVYRRLRTAYARKKFFYMLRIYSTQKKINSLSLIIFCLLKASWGGRKKRIF